MKKILLALLFLSLSQVAYGESFSTSTRKLKPGETVQTGTKTNPDGSVETVTVRPDGTVETVTKISSKTKVSIGAGGNLIFDTPPKEFKGTKNFMDSNFADHTMSNVDLQSGMTKEQVREATKAKNVRLNPVEDDKWEIGVEGYIFFKDGKLYASSR